VATSTWDTLQGKGSLSLDPSTKSILVEAGILVDDGLDELATVIEENRKAIASHNALKHVIQPTAACQLGCDYCGQEHFARHLSEKRQDALVRRLQRRLDDGTYERLEISWFGAEPLLGIKAMRRLSPLLRALAGGQGMEYSSTIVTNGMRLTPAIARELEVIHGVCAAEVTLDGPEAVHDVRRPVKNGNSSFRKIFGNLVAVANTPEIKMKLNLRCNVDSDNADDVPELIDLLAKGGLAKRISLHFAPVYSWGNDADANSLTPGDFARREVEWFAQMHNHGFGLDLLPSRQRIVCLAVHRDGELTDALGTVFNCTEVSYVPTYGNPNRYAIGTLEQDQSAAEAPFRHFNEEILEGEHLQCESCQMLPVCGGACPKQWSEGNTPCPSSKENIVERLTLWYALQQIESGLTL